MSLRIFYHPYYSSLTLPERHRFPLAKYQALYQILATQGYPLSEAPAASRQQITRVHDAD